VTVVSGLPRSGTSLAMQMLRAGGLPLLCDDARAADADNPAGYFEYAPVTRSARDTSWVAGARGRAVKVIAPLLRHLPVSCEYRVLLMQRDLGEVIASQERMLARRGSAPSDGLEPERLAVIFAAQQEEITAWLAARPRFRTLEVAYGALVADPEPVVEKIDAFLGGGLDREAMRAAVDPHLHRNRAASGRADRDPRS
jgi:hypothetical protein